MARVKRRYTSTSHSQKGIGFLGLWQQRNVYCSKGKYGENITLRYTGNLYSIVVEVLKTTAYQPRIFMSTSKTMNIGKLKMSWASESTKQRVNKTTWQNQETQIHISLKFGEERTSQNQTNENLSRLYKNSSQSKGQEIPLERRNFLDEYQSKLVALGFIKTCPWASLQAALHLVPKDWKSKLSTTIDLRPVNADTTLEQWPMPVAKAELSDFEGSKHFASLDFCSGYWQFPLDQSSYDACSIMEQQGPIVATCVLQDLKHAAAYFQSTIPPLFE